jgi:hypothetical protein
VLIDDQLVVQQDLLLNEYYDIPGIQIQPLLELE